MPTVKDKNLLRSACYINGAWLGSDSGKTLAVTNPATGETLTDVPDCGAGETQRAVAAAAAAWPDWRSRTAAEHAKVLRAAGMTWCSSTRTIWRCS